MCAGMGGIFKESNPPATQFMPPAATWPKIPRNMVFFYNLGHTQRMSKVKTLTFPEKQTQDSIMKPAKPGPKTTPKLSDAEVQALIDEMLRVAKELGLKPIPDCSSGAEPPRHFVAEITPRSVVVLLDGVPLVELSAKAASLKEAGFSNPNSRRWALAATQPEMVRRAFEIARRFTQSEYIAFGAPGIPSAARKPLMQFNLSAAAPAAA